MTNQKIETQEFKCKKCESKNWTIFGPFAETICSDCGETAEGSLDKMETETRAEMKYTKEGGLEIVRVLFLEDY